MDMGDEDDDKDADFGDFGGEGEFAPDTASFGGNEELASNFGGNNDGSQIGSSSAKTRVLLDALCSGDLFYENGAGGHSDYAFFDMKKFENATDGNLWAGSQHWKKKPTQIKNDTTKNGSDKKKVMFDDVIMDKKDRKKASKKDRLFIEFRTTPE